MQQNSHYLSTLDLSSLLLVLVILSRNYRGLWSVLPLRDYPNLSRSGIDLPLFLARELPSRLSSTTVGVGRVSLKWNTSDAPLHPTPGTDRHQWRRRNCRRRSQTLANSQVVVTSVSLSDTISRQQKLVQLLTTIGKLCFSSSCRTILLWCVRTMVCTSGSNRPDRGRT